jgi:hypothetical protein
VLDVVLISVNISTETKQMAKAYGIKYRYLIEKGLEWVAKNRTKLHELEDTLEKKNKIIEQLQKTLWEFDKK